MVQIIWAIKVEKVTNYDLKHFHIGKRSRLRNIIITLKYIRYIISILTWKQSLCYIDIRDPRTRTDWSRTKRLGRLEPDRTNKI